MDKFTVTVALITATETEHQAVMYMHDWQEKRFENDKQLYYEAEFVREGKTYRAVCARQNEMGMTAAATLSMKLIGHFRPQYLMMVGIAAGVAPEHVENQEYGDVIVADMLWNYSSGKFVVPEEGDISFGEVGFISRPVFIHALDGVRKYVEEAIHDKENQCHVHIGPIATGSAVVATTDILNKQVRSQHQQTAGLDMEAYAVAYAAENATEPRPTALVIKSVCDFADSQKDDRFQKFAAYTAAEFAKYLYEKKLPLT